MPGLVFCLGCGRVKEAYQGRIANMLTERKNQKKGYGFLRRFFDISQYPPEPIREETWFTWLFGGDLPEPAVIVPFEEWHP